MADWGASGNYHSIHFYAMDLVKVNGSQTWFYHIEAESTFTIRTITGTTNLGTKRILGYVMELTLVIPNNKYDEYQQDFLEMQTDDIVDIDIRFAPFNPDDLPSTGNMTIDAGISSGITVPERQATIMGMSCEGWEITNVERRLRAQIKFKCMYSVELMQSSIFNKYMIY